MSKSNKFDVSKENLMSQLDLGKDFPVVFAGKIAPIVMGMVLGKLSNKEVSQIIKKTLSDEEINFLATLSMLAIADGAGENCDLSFIKSQIK